MSPRKENVEVGYRVLQQEMVLGGGGAGACHSRNSFSEERFDHTPSVASVSFGTWKNQGILVISI